MSCERGGYPQDNAFEGAEQIFEERLLETFAVINFQNERLLGFQEAFRNYMQTPEAAPLRKDILEHIQLMSGYLPEQQAVMLKMLVIAVTAHQHNANKNKRYRKTNDPEGHSVPYAKHVLDVAATLLKEGMDYRSVAAAYGHDLAEDVDLDLDLDPSQVLPAIERSQWLDILRQEFAQEGTDDGEVIPMLIEAVTEGGFYLSKDIIKDIGKSGLAQTMLLNAKRGGARVKKEPDETISEEENNRVIKAVVSLMKLIYRIYEDPRALLALPIKLSDIANNMETPEYVSSEKQLRALIAMKLAEIMRWYPMSWRLRQLMKTTTQVDLPYAPFTNRGNPKARGFVDAATEGSRGERSPLSVEVSHQAKTADSNELDERLSNEIANSIKNGATPPIVQLIQEIMRKRGIGSTNLKEVCLAGNRWTTDYRWVIPPDNRPRGQLSYRNETNHPEGSAGGLLGRQFEIVGRSWVVVVVNIASTQPQAWPACASINYEVPNNKDGGRPHKRSMVSRRITCHIEWVSRWLGRDSATYYVVVGPKRVIVQICDSQPTLADYCRNEMDRKPDFYQIPEAGFFAMTPSPAEYDSETNLQSRQLGQILWFLSYLYNPGLLRQSPTHRVSVLIHGGRVLFVDDQETLESIAKEHGIPDGQLAKAIGWDPKESGLSKHTLGELRPIKTNDPYAATYYVP